MKPVATIAAVAFGVALPLLVAVPRATGDDAASSCIEVGGLSVWGVTGYNHVVYLTNRCDKTFDCLVSTSVTPEPRQASVPPNTTVHVVTALNSSTGLFVAHVTCDLAAQSQ